MRTPFIAGNWKMNTTHEQATDLVKGLVAVFGSIEKVIVAICPPFPYLVSVFRLLQDSRIHLGAQNMSWEEEGALTGEVSARMLKDVGCRYVILGHSERRHIFGERDGLVNCKIKQALGHGLFPIVCMGETTDEREDGRTEQVIESQIKGCLGNLNAEEMRSITVAYEPVWAIGTGKTATPEQAQEVHQFIRAWIRKQFNDDIASSTIIQYGGSVKPDNAKNLFNQPDIDGALVGGASLKVESFAGIIQAVISEDEE